MKTLGETRMRVDFAATNEVAKLKQEFAKLIDKVNDVPIDHLDTDAEKNEAIRCKTIAMTQLESAGMFAVKAMTTGL